MKITKTDRKNHTFFRENKISRQKFWHEKLNPTVWKSWTETRCRDCERAERNKIGSEKIKHRVNKSQFRPFFYASVLANLNFLRLLSPITLYYHVNYKRSATGWVEKTQNSKTRYIIIFRFMPLLKPTRPILLGRQRSRKRKTWMIKKNLKNSNKKKHWTKNRDCTKK